MSRSSQKPSGCSASGPAWIERKWSPPVERFCSSNVSASATWMGVRMRASKYWVSRPTSMCSSRDSRTAATKARSRPVSHAAMALERREKITSPATITSGDMSFAGTGQSWPKPMFSGVIEPPAMNSAYGSVATAYCSPRSCSGSLTGSFMPTGSGRGLRYPGIAGYTLRSRSSSQSNSAYVTRLGLHCTSGSSLRAIEIMFFICARKKRIVVGGAGCSSISFCTRLRSSRLLTQFDGTASTWRSVPVSSVTRSSQSFLPSAP
mmetsp:Transcript_40199/g.106422  ORF Transcript_40199/g.106422 Transcript_40199/m.106422 type:complete len:263 (-) Transcript_40199:280-1068(-)